MPGFDRTGPLGQGPMTGGRRGRCVSDADLPEVNRGAGYGRGMGRGRGAGVGPGGRGRRNQYYATGLTGWQRAEMDAAGLQPSRDARLERLEQQLDEALARLAHVEGTK